MDDWSVTNNEAAADGGTGGRKELVAAAGVDVNTNGYEENGDECKVNDGVH